MVARKKKAATRAKRKTRAKKSSSGAKRKASRKPAAATPKRRSKAKPSVKAGTGVVYSDLLREVVARRLGKL